MTRPPLHLWRTTWSALPVVARRARADRPALTAYAALATLVTVGALQAPLAFERAADDGLRVEVAASEELADVVVSGAVRGVASEDPDTLPDAVTAVLGILPPALRDVTGDPAAALLMPRMSFDTNGEAPDGRIELVPVTVLGADVTWTEGEAPAGPDQVVLSDEQPHPVGTVGLSADAAEKLGLRVGDVVEAEGSKRIAIKVAGIFEPVDPAAAAWDSVPTLVRGFQGEHAELRPSALVDAASAEALGFAELPAPSFEVRLPIDVGALRSADLPALQQALRLTGEAQVLLPVPDVVQASLETGLDQALGRYQQRLSVALAQATTVLTGVALLAAVVVNQAAGLVAARRRTVLSLERARGSSVAAVVVRALLESLPVAALALGVGLASTAWLGGPPHGVALGPAVVTVAATAFAPALHAWGIAAASWTGRRVPANRRDRRRAAKVRGSWRVSGEVTVVALAVAAVAATLVRGLGVGGDLLVAAAPVLLAFACTLVLVRVVPAVVRAAARRASRSGSVVTLVGLSRVARPGAVGVATVLLVVTTATALAVYGGAAAASIADAPDRAAALVVGADARVDGPDRLTAEQALAPRAGVTAAVGTVLGSRTLSDGAGPDVTVLAVDPEVFPQLAALDPAVTGLPGPGDPLPALVDPRIARTVELVTPTVWTIQAQVPLDVAGTIDLGVTGPLPSPDGPPEQPVVVVARDALASVLGKEPSQLDPSVVWLDGPGSDALAAELAERAEPRSVRTLTGLTDDLRTDPLAGGVTGLLRLTTGLVGVLAAIAVILALAGGGTERLRVLAVLRTLGVRRRAARGLTLVELLPAAAVALVVGSAAGVLLARLLIGALDLGALMGAGTPPLRLPLWPFAVAPAAAALAFAAGSVLSARAARQLRVGEVLRTW